MLNKTKMKQETEDKVKSKVNFIRKSFLSKKDQLNYVILWADEYIGEEDRLFRQRVKEAINKL